MIDATRGFTKRLHDSPKSLCSGRFRHLPVKTLALHFYGCTTTVQCRQTPSATKDLTNARSTLTPRFTPPRRIAHVRDTHISRHEIMKTFLAGVPEAGRERPDERGPEGDAGACRAG
ncbi:hypothetical protein, partial [Burkholderia cenocepacia]|uniref:hypothetical protein n=1 Tax=Burkholderia cenocepacia TaxID=95486 RepID=UPI001E534BE0